MSTIFIKIFTPFYEWPVNVIFFSIIVQVAFKRVLGQASSGQVALFVTIIGVTNLIFFTPFIFVFKHFEFDHFEWSRLPWTLLVGTAALGLCFNFLTIFGVAYTYPLFISIGALLGVPVNAAVDALFRDAEFGVYKYISFLMIVVGFTLLLIPLRRVERIERKIRCYMNDDEYAIIEETDS